jgi:hypothetical protein
MNDSRVALKLEDLYVGLKEENDTHVEYIDYWIPVAKSLVDKYVERYGLETQCASECVNCQITHIEKYKEKYPNHVNQSYKMFLDAVANDRVATPSHPFQISCGYIPEKADYLGFLDDNTRANLTEQQDKAIRAVKDPVSFAQQYFNWNAFKHQELMLRCQSKNKVLRWGRRSGKSESSAIEILWHAITKNRQVLDPVSGNTVTSGLKILVVAPFESQVMNIFDMLLLFLRRNPETDKLIATYRKSPYHYLELTNGARISGFTTGQNDADSLRGQDAHFIYLDECDYMGPGDYKTIMAIKSSHQDVLIRASSTPKGVREKFWEWCTNNPQWKEFYFPSAVIDRTPYEISRKNWRQMRMELRPEYSFDDWMQEIMAIFVNNVSGVYAPSLVTKAMKDYTYLDMRQQHAMNNFISWKFSIGVDWNSNVGTEICVLGHHRSHGFRVMEMVNVPKQQSTQLKGLEAIVDLIKFWKPTYVYVDAGHGATNWEMLRLWSVSQEVGTYERNLESRIKKYEFGSKVEIRDPVSGILVSHPAKAYMVENSVRKFEDEVIELSAHDDKIRKQLLNYIIKSRSEAGKPIYGFENKLIADHALDALNISLVAFALEESIMAPQSPFPITTVGILGNTVHMINANRDNPNVDMTAREALRESVGSRYNSIDKRNSGVKEDERDFPNLRLGFMSDTEDKILNDIKKASVGTLAIKRPRPNIGRRAL